jgi:hypothetical protein
LIDKHPIASPNVYVWQNMTAKCASPFAVKRVVFIMVMRQV